MKPKKVVKKENKQIVEIHIYVHQNFGMAGSAGSGTFFSDCTCGKRGTTSNPCPVHPLNPPYVITC